MWESNVNGLRMVGVSVAIFFVVLVIPLSAVTAIFGCSCLSGSILKRLRRRRRRRRGLCVNCGYNLWGNESGTCPECGEKVERKPPN